MFIHPKFVYKRKKNSPNFKVFFLKNTPKYHKLSKIINISIKTMLELRTKFGNFGNFGHISDGLRKQYSVRTQCCNLIGSKPLYIPCSGRLWGMYKRSEPMGRLHSVQKHMANVYLPLQFKEVEMFREHTR